MAGNVIAEFLTAIRFVADEASAQRAEGTARRVERTVRSADVATTRGSIQGSNARLIAANREQGIRTRGAAALIGEMRARQQVEAATTVQVVRATRVRTVAEGAAHTQRNRFNAAAIGYAERIASVTRLTALAVVGTTTTIASAAISATAVIGKMADGFEKLFYTAQKTGSSAGGLRAFGFAASQLGSSQQEALSSLEAVAGRIRRSPGFETMLKGLGVETHDAAGNVLSFEKRVLSLGRALAKRPEHQRYAYADALGIDENTLRALTSGEMEKAFNEYQAMLAKAGLDPEKADRDSKKFMDVYRRLWASVSIIATKIQGELVGAFGDQIEQFTKYLLDNADGIARGCVEIGKGILEIVKAGVELVKRFTELDPQTKDFALKMGALAAALLLFNAGPLGVLGAIAVGVAAFASPENIAKLRQMWSAFDDIAKRLTGQDGLTLAMEALAAVMVLKLLAPLSKVVGLLTALGGMRPPAWLLGLLGVGVAAKVANDNGILNAGEGARSWHEGIVRTLDPGIADRVYGKTPQDRAGEQKDGRTLWQRVMPKALGGKDAPGAPGAPGGTPGPQGDGAGAPGAPAGRGQQAPSNAQGRENVRSWLEFAQKPVEEGGLGLTKEQAHGLVATMQGESGRNLDPAAYNPNDRGKPSGGTAQWRGDRLRNLQAFAEREGTDWRDRSVQQRFLRHEFMGQRGDLGGGSEARAYRALKAAKTREEALYEGVSKMERPQYPDAEVRKRSQYLYGHDEAPSAKAPEQAGVLPGGAPSVLKPDSMKDAPGETIAEAERRRKAGSAAPSMTLAPPPAVDWAQKRDKATISAQEFNDRFNDSMLGRDGAALSRRAPPLGVGPQSSNTDARSYRGGDVRIEVSGVSDPKEAAMLTERAVRSREADTLRGMRSAFG